MNRKVFSILLLATIIMASPVMALDVGDKAPPLSIIKWVKGKRVSFPKDLGNKLYLVEFWATWCPPCKMSIPLLTRLQDKHKKELTIIGVTDPDDRGNSVSAIERFTKKQGEDMSYSVAIDDLGKTTKAYLVAAGIQGIPHSFLVGKDGRIIWHGSPLDPELMVIVPEIISGKYNVEEAINAKKLQAEISQRFQDISMDFQRGKISRAWDGIISVLKLDPSNEEAMDVLMQLYVTETRDRKAFRTFVSGHIASYRDNSKAMRTLARILCSNMDITSRVPDLTIEAARAGYNATDKKDPIAIAIYALALYQVGDLDKAIALQKEAVSALGSEEDQSLVDALAFYEKCKRLISGTS